jgi:predicted small integral membrane protein
MILRLSKCILLLGVSFYFTLVALNNLVDYNANYQFVRHILMMDTIFPNSPSLWRSFQSPAVHTLFYSFIIAGEAVIAILSWWGSINLLRALRATHAAFQKAKSAGIAALTLACILWLVGFLTIGGEWFLMWQSHGWNGQEEAFRMFTICSFVLIYLTMNEPEAAHS